MNSIKFKIHQDATGVPTVNGHTTLGNIKEIDIGSDKYVYTYNTPPAGQTDETLKSVQLLRGSSTTPIQEVDYTYYQKQANGQQNAHGTLNDLQSAIVSMNGVITSGSFYRYNKSGQLIDAVTGSSVCIGGCGGNSTPATPR